MGGVVVGYEMGRQLGVPAIFFERVDGKLVLRRGFSISPGARVLMVEDIVTTGLSSRECIAGINAEGGVTVGAACLIDRSGGKADIGVPLAALPGSTSPPMRRTSCRRSLPPCPPSSPAAGASHDHRHRQ
jgi:orotate phosphoribosyltransferase